MKKLAIVSAVVGCLACAATAMAASTPTVTPHSVTGITTTTAVLNGTVNPNGSHTVYHFDYGLTTALGTLTASTSVGSGTTAVAVKAALTKLTPGETYYYTLVATNGSGTSTSRVETFKTGGNPPPVPTTGGAQGVEANQITMTGLVVTEGQPTTYYFQYGLAPTYGLQTAPVTIPASATPVAVTTTVTGLAPGATFHYRLVAAHAGVDEGVGLDAAVETLPFPVPVARLHVRTRPGTVNKLPFRLITSGSVVNPAAATTPDTLACNTAIIAITFREGRRVIATNQTSVGPTCQLTAATTTIRKLPHVAGLARNAPVRLRVEIQFEGSPYLAPSKVFETVTVK